MDFKISIFGLWLFLSFGQGQINNPCGSTINVTSNTRSLNITDVNCIAKPCIFNITSDDNTNILYLFTKFFIHPRDLVVLSDDSRSFSFSNNSQVLENYYITSHDAQIQFISQCHNRIDGHHHLYFSVDMTAQSYGKYYENEGQFSCDDISSDSSIENENYYLLNTNDAEQEIKKNMIVHLNYSLGTKVDFYDGQSETEENKIASFAVKDDVYDVFSISNTMLIKVTSMNQKAKPCLVGSFKSIDKGSNQLSQGNSGSSQLTNIGEGNFTWIVKPKNNDANEISFTIHSLSENEGRHLEIRSGLGDIIKPFLKFSSVDIERTFYASASLGIRVDYTQLGSETNTGPNIVLSMSYEVIPECAFIASESAPVTSPGYPTKYPFHASCNWQLAKSVVAGKVVHVSFSDFDVYDADSLTIKDKFQKQNVSSTDDLIYNSDDFNMMFQSGVEGIDKPPHRGFNLKLEVLECGSSFDKTYGQFVTPANSTSTRCIWRLDIPNVNHGNINVKIQITNPQRQNANLTIYDGGNSGNGTLPVKMAAPTQTLISKTTKMLFVLDFAKLDQSKPATTFGINWLLQKCENGEMCRNGICMHEDWKCNGINDCGDYSDEELCVPYDCGEPETFTEPFVMKPNIERNNQTLNCHWPVKSTLAGTTSLLIQVEDFQLNNDMDILILSEGKGAFRRVLSKLTNDSDTTDLILVTSGNELFVELISNQTNEQKPDFSLKITPQVTGRYIFGKRHLTIGQKQSDLMEFYQLESAIDQQLSVQVNITNNPNMPNYEICFYDGFYKLNVLEIDCFNSSNSNTYEVVSNNNQMVVSVINFNASNAATLDVKSIQKGHNTFFHDSRGSVVLTNVNITNNDNDFLWRIKSQDGVAVITVKRLDLFDSESFTIFEGMLATTKQTIKTFSKPLDSAFTIHVDTTRGILLEYNPLGVHNNPLPTIDFSFEVFSSQTFDTEVLVGAHQNSIIASPDYPNQYPLNAICKWTIKIAPGSTSKSIAVIFEEIDLLSQHKLIIRDSQTLLTAYGSELPDILIINEPVFYMYWNSTTETDSEDYTRGKGFKINLLPLEFGENVTKPAGMITTQNTSETTTGLWSIDVPSMTPANLHFSVSTNNRLIDGKLTIYDGGKLTSQKFKYSPSKAPISYISNTTKILVMYETEFDKNSSTPFIISYTIQNCPKDNLCKNQHCLHDEWKCNGINECGDFTDEELCVPEDCGSTVIVKTAETLLSLELSKNKTFNCHWTIQAANTYKYLSVTVKDLQLNEEDALILRDSSSQIIQKFTKDSNYEGLFLVSSGSNIFANFITNQSSIKPSFTLSISPQESGKYMLRNGSAKLYQTTSGVVELYQLEADSGQQVSAQVNIVKNPKMPDYEICFYDGIFISTVSELDCFSPSNNNTYTVVSNSNQMLVSIENFNQTNAATLNVTSVQPGHNTFFLDSRGSISLPNVNTNGNGYLWRIKSDAGIAVITVKRLALAESETFTIFEGMLEIDEQTVKTFSEPLDSAFTIHVDATNGILLKYNSLGEHKDPLPTIDVSFEVFPPNTFDNGVVVKSHDTQLITSPDYPNQYPFNAICKWMITIDPKSTIKSVAVIFDEIELLPQHQFIVRGEQTLLTAYGSELPDILIIDEPVFYLYWNSTVETDSEGYTRGKGFKINLMPLDYGKNVTITSGSITTQTEVVVSNGLWAIDVPNEKPANLLFSISTHNISKNGNLTIYDGGKLTSRQIDYHPSVGTTSYTSYTTKILVKYDTNFQKQTSTQYNITYNVQSCANDNLCKNGICLQDEWRCNGVNDCGDFSDEELCVPEDCGKTVIVETANTTISPELSKNKTFNCHWKIQAANTFKYLSVTVEDLQLNEEDTLILRDSSHQIIQKFTRDSNYEGLFMVSSGSNIFANFITNQSSIKPSFTLSITPQENGKYIFEKGEVTVSQQTAPEYFAFETEADKQVKVLLDVSNQSLPGYEICFYDGFHKSDPNLGCFRGTLDQSYPIVSNGNKMLALASGFVGASSAILSMASVASGYNNFYVDIVGNLILRSSTPDKYIWRIKPSAKGVIVFNLKKLDLYPDEYVVIKEGMLDTDQNILQIERPLDSSYVFHANAENGLLIVYHCNHYSNDNSFATFDASYEVVPAEEFNRVVPLEIKGSHYVVTSPGYPNQYPVNADCSWKFTRSNTTSFVHLLIEDLELSSAHKLFITAENKTVMILSGTELPDDLIITEPEFDITWSSAQENRSTGIEKLGKGFKIIVTTLACGGNLTKDASTIEMTPENATIECLWIISGNNQHSLIEFQIKPQHVKYVDAQLIIHDGGSERSQMLDNVTSNIALKSESNKLLIRYNFYLNVSNNSTDIAFKIPYTVNYCKNKTEQCGTGYCMHPDWKCNGINDCGDNTDELDCYSPVGLTVIRTEGVSTGLFVGVIFIVLIAGFLLGFLLIPFIIRKVRERSGGSYESFNEAATNESDS